MTEEDEEFDRIAAKCKETERVNESKWNSEMCSNYGGFCKKEWRGLTDEEVELYWDWEDFQTGAGRTTIFEMVRNIETKLKEKNT
jgi:hypothetical protein